ncbi:DNA-binding protein WhiA [Periweissella fabaria]|uniref:Probable cell division protein WhiA n=1 Tax=Periweissella fabaria TaxID=546157 RepID=A0ABM8Z7Y0_9LACO|nr:DNA-binding protein WhiA [Periweissella fabaria]MCM0597965.1 DNA-binding protein WhiA [Periweissella fabaria]CAH0417434.1 putative cell division protein WhiA [Periweissella fabaria]
MSYASDVKKELTSLEVHENNAKAELSALIRMNGALGLSNRQFILNVQTENAATARRIYSLLQQFYKVEAEVVIRRQMKLKKNNVYLVRLKYQVQQILDDLQIMKGFEINEDMPKALLQRDSERRSYLRGAFLAAGSVNNPEKSRYHLEIYSLYQVHNEQLAALMNEYHLNAKTTERRSGYIVYLKEAEKIADFLQLIGATNSMLQFEDVRIMRDIKNSVNRLTNAEEANANKVADASARQIDNIKLIDDQIGLMRLPIKLRQIAEARLNHPDVSLGELGDFVTDGPISKSGVNHRLRKINEYAQAIRDGLPLPGSKKR